MRVRGQGRVRAASGGGGLRRVYTYICLRRERVEGLAARERARDAVHGEGGGLVRVGVRVGVGVRVRVEVKAMVKAEVKVKVGVRVRVSPWRR